MTLIEKQQKHRHDHEEIMRNMNILKGIRYYLLIKSLNLLNNKNQSKFEFYFKKISKIKISRKNQNNRRKNG